MRSACSYQLANPAPGHTWTGFSYFDKFSPCKCHAHQSKGKWTTTKWYSRKHSPLATFSHNTSTYLFRSVRDCSCQKPTACIISCMMIPFLSHPGPTDRSWGPEVENCLPTRDQQLKNIMKQKRP